MEKSKWDIQAAIDAQVLKAGKVPNPYHWSTEILSIEEVIEKYGYALTDTEKEMLVLMNNMSSATPTTTEEQEAINKTLERTIKKKPTRPNRK